MAAASEKHDETTTTAASDFSEHEDDVVFNNRSFDRKLCLKIDRQLLVPFVLLNFLSLMGRTNVGAALIQKLPADLHLNATKVFLVTAIPAVALILLEVPSNLLMRWLERNVGLSHMTYLSIITILLGLVTLGQAFVQSYGGILATRFLVGVFDCGLIPGAVYVCSLFYPGEHLQWRLSMLMAANISSNIVSNILAYAIAHINNTNGWHGWRWIFLVEGCLTMAIGLVCCVWRISGPESARFLTDEEKRIVISTIRTQSKQTQGLAREWKMFLTNPLNYLWAALYVFTCTTAYSIAIFAPSFVQSFYPKYTVPEIQGQVVPIFVVGACACLATAVGADYFDHRFSFAVGGYVFSIIGYAILSQAHVISTQVTMFALYFVSIGVYIALPMIWTMTLVNLPTPFQRSIGCGFVVGIGNTASFVSAWIFRTSQAPTHYRDGMKDGLIMTVVSVVLVLLAWLYISWHNRRVADHVSASGVAKMSIDAEERGAELAARSRAFRYRT